MVKKTEGKSCTFCKTELIKSARRTCCGSRAGFGKKKYRCPNCHRVFVLK